MRHMILALAVALALVACTSPRYAADSPPHATWKDRDGYCYFFQVDPKGADNTQIGYADEAPTVEATDAGFLLRAANARVSTDLYGTDYRGDPGDDYFRRDVVWATDSDGFVRVENRCR